jgi:CRP-like cAMP-binding protein
MVDLSDGLMSSLGYELARYEARIARPEDLERCYAIRKQVFGETLQLTDDLAISPAREDQYDAKSVVVAGWDKQTNEIVGTFRVTFAPTMLAEPSFAEIGSLSMFPSKMLNKVGIFSRPALMPEYGKSALLHVLTHFGFRYCLENEILIAVIVCEPNFYSFYRHLGFRPLTRTYKSQFGDYRLPLFLMPHDYNHLKLCSSSFYDVAEEVNFPKNNTALDWFEKKVQKIMLVDPGFSQTSSAKSDIIDSSVLHGLTPAGRESLLKNAMSIHCKAKDLIISKNAGDRTFGFIKSGLAEVVINKETVAILGKGDIFGEIAFILGIPRTADVIAAIPETEVVVLSVACLRRLALAEDRAILWQNIARVLASRVAHMNY